MIYQGLDDGIFIWQYSRATMSYIKDLSAYALIMAPIVWSIKALEGQAMNVEDTYMFWLAIAASLQKLFTHNDEIDTELVEKVTAIVTR